MLKYFQSSPVPERPLIRQVVNRKQRRDVGVSRIKPVFRFQVSGNKPCLPVVGVKDVDFQVQKTNRLHRRAAEENVPLAVVDKIRAVRILVNAVAIEIILLIDQIHRRVGSWHDRFENAPFNRLVSNGSGKLQPRVLNVKPLLESLFVSGNNQRAFVPGTIEFYRQGTADVS